MPNPGDVVTFANCACCSSSSSSSKGSSSSSSSSGACGPAGCCGNPLPCTLKGSLTYSCSPACGDIPGTGDLTWDGTQWAGTFTICGHTWSMKLSCVASGIPGGWSCVSDGCVFTGYSGSVQSISCSPFQVVFAWSWAEHCCPDGSIGSGLFLTVTK